MRAVARTHLVRKLLSRRLAVPGLTLLALAAVACSNPRAWYRVDDYPGFTLRPLVDFEQPIDQPTKGAPPRMLEYNRQLNVGCAYCHVEGDATTCNLTSAGTASRLMIDLSDRFKVSCSYCHAQSPTKLTRAGRYAERDMRIPERRWTCASCHDAGFKVTRRG